MPAFKSNSGPHGTRFQQFQFLDWIRIPRTISRSPGRCLDPQKPVLIIDWGQVPTFLRVMLQVEPGVSEPLPLGERSFEGTRRHYANCPVAFLNCTDGLCAGAIWPKQTQS